MFYFLWYFFPLFYILMKMKTNYESANLSFTSIHQNISSKKSIASRISSDRKIDITVEKKLSLSLRLALLRVTIESTYKRERAD